MAYHINARGDAKRCRATRGNCPFGSSEEHRATAQEARELYEDRMTAEIIAQQATGLSTASTAHALSAPLVYEGPIPHWLGKLEKEGAEVFGVQPRMIDVLPTSLGPLAVVYEERSLSEGDRSSQLKRGYEVQQLTYRALDTGEVLGYLKIGHMSRESLKRSFGDDDWTLLRFMDDFRGGDYGLYTYEDGDADAYEANPLRDPLARAKTEEEREVLKQHIWARAHTALKVIPKSYDKSKLDWSRRIDPQYAPAGKELDAELKEVQKLPLRTFNDALADHGDPTIDFIRLKDAALGKGLSASLYVYGARMMAAKGLTLRSSTLQSPEAERAWDSMARNPALPIVPGQKVWSRSGDVSKVYFLDFRKKGEGS